MAAFDPKLRLNEWQLSTQSGHKAEVSGSPQFEEIRGLDGTAGLWI
jgi:hypothetical protein